MMLIYSLLLRADKCRKYWEKNYLAAKNIKKATEQNKCLHSVEIIALKIIINMYDV